MKSWSKILRLWHVTRLRALYRVPAVWNCWKDSIAPSQSRELRKQSAMLALLARIFQNLADPKQQHSLANRKILGKTGTFQSNSSGIPIRRSWSHYTLHCLDLQECFRHFHINVENVRLIMQDHFSNDKVRLNEFERFKVWSLVSLTSKSLRIQEVLLRNPR